MSRKTYGEWKNLVEQQITIGLAVPKFCDQYQLNTMCFYARKAIMAKDNNRAYTSLNDYQANHHHPTR